MGCGCRGDPASPSSRSSPTVEAPEGTLPPPADDELVRQECDGTRPGAQERVREKVPVSGDDLAERASSGGQDDEVVAVDDLVRHALLELGGLAPRDPAQRG